MSLVVKQTCDICTTGCLEERDLTEGLVIGIKPTLKDAAGSGGWKDLGNNRHVCPPCIESLLTTPPSN